VNYAHVWKCSIVFWYLSVVIVLLDFPSLHWYLKVLFLKILLEYRRSVNRRKVLEIILINY